MASGVYNRGKLLLATRGWLALDLRLALVTSSYTPDDVHNVVSELSGELSGGGYARATLTQTTPTEDDANDRATRDAADVTFPSLALAAGTPRYAIVYHEGAGTDATRELVCWIDLGTTGTAPEGTDYVVQWDASGVVRLG